MSAPKGRAGGFWRDNSLTQAFGGAFLVVLACQAIAGRAEFNEAILSARLRGCEGSGPTRTAPATRASPTP
ncbi:hypothetical protein ACFQ7Z_15820 [Streptomyces virginiae]|uniref:hypothetical protein n=1 Tax=Streptomyces virginiae TaxID=1961 RepID=UPI003680CDE5